MRLLGIIQGCLQGFHVWKRRPLHYYYVSLPCGFVSFLFDVVCYEIRRQKSPIGVEYVDRSIRATMARDIFIVLESLPWIVMSCSRLLFHRFYGS